MERHTRSGEGGQPGRAEKKNSSVWQIRIIIIAGHEIRKRSRPRPRRGKGKQKGVQPRQEGREGIRLASRTKTKQEGQNFFPTRMLFMKKKSGRGYPEEEPETTVPALEVLPRVRSQESPGRGEEASSFQAAKKKSRYREELVPSSNQAGSARKLYNSREKGWNRDHTPFRKVSGERGHVLYESPRVSVRVRKGKKGVSTRRGWALGLSQGMKGRYEKKND